ncbi:MAG: hypothetical protein Pars92KO_22020 [Parasphingorhabdus sp.]
MKNRNPTATENVQIKKIGQNQQVDSSLGEKFDIERLEQGEIPSS